MGIDVLTMGNHTFAKSDLFNFIDEADRLVRPMNLSPTDAGKGVRVFVVKGLRIAVVNLCGEVFMHDITESPCSCMERVLKDVEADLYLVDLHGEATSEKIAFTYAFSGRAQVVVGTHTHVQTADERIVNGTAAISDLGMCGAYTSVLGRDVKAVSYTHLEALAETHDLAVALAFRVEVAAAFAAAHRQRCQCVLEDLFKSQELDDADVDGRMKAQAAFVWADGRVELYAVAAVDQMCIRDRGKARKILSMKKSAHSSFNRKRRAHRLSLIHI